jgi:hypothetical protein
MDRARLIVLFVIGKKVAPLFSEFFHQKIQIAKPFSGRNRRNRFDDIENDNLGPELFSQCDAVGEGLAGRFLAIDGDKNLLVHASTSLAADRRCEKFEANFRFNFRGSFRRGLR